MILSSNCLSLEHKQYVKRKYLTSISYIKRLWQRSFTGNRLWNIHLSLCFCHIAYAWPAWCSISDHQLKDILSLHKMVANWAGIDAECSNNSLLARLNLISSCLMRTIDINYSNHPLSKFFVRRNDVSYAIRHRHKLLPISFKSKLATTSFLKFFKQT